MAITKTIDTPIKREERTDEVVISAPIGKGYQVRILRVTRDYFVDAVPVEVGRRWLTRSMPQLMADTQALPMLVALPAIFDRWAEEDDAAEAARIAAEVAEIARLAEVAAENAASQAAAEAAAHEAAAAAQAAADKAAADSAAASAAAQAEADAASAAASQAAADKAAAEAPLPAH